LWITTAWQCISPEVTVKGIKQCYISIAVDETDDDMLWEGIAKDGDVGGGDEGTDCEDGDSDTDW